MKSRKSNKNKMIIIISSVLVLIIGLIVLSICLDGNNNVGGLNADRIMSDGTYQIRFSDLVSLESLEVYNNKKVAAVGYLSPVMSYDGSFGYLMNLPYQTCPYCQPSDTKITNTIAIFAKNGEKINFTESAVIVKGTLKLESYTDAYGYTYNYRITDAVIEVADTSELSDKITLYNQLADKEILTGIMNTLYYVELNVFYNEYTANGAKYDRQVVSTDTLDVVIENLKGFNQKDVEILVNVADKLKQVISATNALVEEQNFDELTKYKSTLYSLYSNINSWMAEYEL